MNKRYIFSLIALLSLFMLSCQKTSNIEQLLENINTYSVKLENSTKWSIISADGKIIVADSFASAPTVAIDGIFAAYDSLGISFMRLHTSENYSRINGLNSLRNAGAPACGLIPITRRYSPIEIVDTTGYTLFFLNDIQGRNFSACGPLFSDNLLIVREQGTKLWGAINTNGHIAVEPKYQSITIFNCGHALAITPDNNTVIVTEGGKEKSLPEGFTPLSGNFVYNHALLINNRTGDRCLTDTQGKITKYTSSQVPVAIGKSGVFCIDNTGAYVLHSFSGKETHLTDWSVAAPVPTSTQLIGCKNNNWIIANNELKTLYQAPDSCTITPLLGNKAFFISGKNMPAFLISNQFAKIENLPISRLEQKLYLSDIILSDRDEDHREFNTANPGDKLPDWMGTDTLTVE